MMNDSYEWKGNVMRLDQMGGLRRRRRAVVRCWVVAVLSVLWLVACWVDTHDRLRCYRIKQATFDSCKDVPWHLADTAVTMQSLIDPESGHVQTGTSTEPQLLIKC
jgi:hypothetical protein